jgi:RHS repeat-associated protein
MIAASRTVSGSNQVNTTIVYDAANRETTITDWVYTPSGGGGGTSTPLATYVYGYDNANRVTSEQDAEGTATFTYDHANELTAVGGSRTESYSYDLNGNRNSTGYTTGTANEQTAAPGATYTYDNAGNLVSQTNTSTHVVTTYTYDYRNRLTEVEQGGTIIATYTYDALDRRIGIDDNGTQTWTVYDGTSADALPYADFDGSGNLTERYLAGSAVVNGAIVDQLLARTDASGNTAWYLTDKLGSGRDVVDTSGNGLDHVVYDSFGNILSESNTSNGDRFKYAGMEYDANTGQNYDRARYYDEAIGRFMALDPQGFKARDMNLYRYVGNGPVNGTDLSGMNYTVSLRRRSEIT